MKKMEENQNEEKPLSIVEQAKAERKEMEELLERIKSEKNELNQLKAETILSGRAEAGIIPDKPKELTPTEYKEKIMKGEIP